jgi:hypothetical protein
MRGPFDDQGQLFSYISPEQRVPAQHPLRTIRELVREVFRDLTTIFAYCIPRQGACRSRLNSC